MNEQKQPQTPCVQWHDGGPLWAGDTTNHPNGFYYYAGAGAEPTPVKVWDDYGDEITPQYFD